MPLSLANSRRTYLGFYESGFTQAQIAAKIGKSQGYVSTAMILARSLAPAVVVRLSQLAPNTILLEDLSMIGCGTGAGLRIGELLALEVEDLQLDAADPHLIVRYGGDHHAPPKGRRVRRVELFEPGLGFWRFWMANFYLGKVRVFEGPSRGYQSHWPEKFPGWSDTAGKKLSSHIVRHIYAVAMLSGSWG